MDGASGIVSIFGRALELQSPAERAAYLDSACTGDAKLRAEIDQLLLLESKIDSKFMAPKQPASEPTIDLPGDEAVNLTGFDDTPASPRSDEVGSRIGPYTLLQKIGAGGNGHRLPGRTARARAAPGSR